jgi:hypothetical protein
MYQHAWQVYAMRPIKKRCTKREAYPQGWEEEGHKVHYLLVSSIVKVEKEIEKKSIVFLSAKTA